MCGFFLLFFSFSFLVKNKNKKPPKQKPFFSVLYLLWKIRGKILGLVKLWTFLPCSGSVYVLAIVFLGFIYLFIFLKQQIDVLKICLCIFLLTNDTIYHDRFFPFFLALTSGSLNSQFLKEIERWDGIGITGEKFFSR